MSLSFPQKRYLLALRNKTPVNAHCNTQSDYGGLSGTVYWAYRRGLITLAPGELPRLTAAGRKLADTLVPPSKPEKL